MVAITEHRVQIPGKPPCRWTSKYSENWSLNK